MRILFFLAHAGHLRNFRSTVSELGDRGHEVHVALDRRPKKAQRAQVRVLDELAQTHARVSYGPAPPRDKTGWQAVGTRFRAALDYMRFLEPDFDQTPTFRERAREMVPRSLRWAATAPAAGPWSARRLLKAAEESVPVSPATRDFIGERAPDAVLVSPLIELGSPQLEYVRAARELGVPTGLLVASWDNLTNRGVLHELPELVTVWNEAQKQEAVELHGVPADRVAVTGAAAYDHWFGREPGSTRDAFAERVGLDSSSPFVLYLGSSPSIAPDEPVFIEDWVRRAREHTAGGFQVLVRPHPLASLRAYQSRLEALGGVAVFPRDGEDPVDERSQEAYFDSLYHAAAVVGINTSGFIESAIVGRCAHTILVDRYEDTQARTLHFRKLVREADSVVRVARSWAEHGSQLRAAIGRNGAGPVDHEAFLRSFVRPRGLDRPATPLMVEAVESLQSAAVEEPSRRTSAVGRGLAIGARTMLRRRAGRPRDDDSLNGAASGVEPHPRPEAEKPSAKAAPRDGGARKKPAKVAVEPASAGSGGPEEQPVPQKLAQLAGKAVGLRPQDASTEIQPPALVRFQTQTASELEFLRAQVAQLADRTNPVIAGPFMTEVGFELLYWIPLLRWAVHEFPGLAERLVVVSRGGTQSWSADFADRYVDVLSIVTPEELMARRESLKQRDTTDFEHSIYREVKARLGIDRADVLHPSLLFNTYYRLLKVEQRTWARSILHHDDGVDGFATRHKQIVAPFEPDVASALPDDFVAVRFYFRPSFPDTPKNRRFAAAALEALTRKTNVVLLNNQLELDDHYDFTVKAGDRVTTVHELMRPETNLHVQTVVMSRARAFVGTYGGLAYLAPFLGVPSLSVSSDLQHTHPWHLDLANRVFDGKGWGSMLTLRPEDLGLAQLLLSDFPTHRLTDFLP
jgi:hypothetical protein